MILRVGSHFYLNLKLCKFKEKIIQIIILIGKTGKQFHLIINMQMWEFWDLKTQFIIFFVKSSHHFTTLT